MRQDQIERMRELSEKLAEVVLEEADPDTWPGAGMPLADLSKDDRGDRYWCKKNAAATFALLQRAQSTLQDISTPHPARGPDDEGDVDKDIARQEKEAARVLAAAMARAKGVTNGNGQP